MTVYLLELTGLNPQGQTETRYFCSGVGYTSGPNDNPSNKIYESRLNNPGRYERHMWQPGSSQAGSGASSTLGIVELGNANGALDEFLDWDFDGRSVLLLRGDEKQAKSAFQVVLAGIAQSCGVNETVVQINLRDPATALQNVPVTTVRYGGTNVLPDGVDGTAADIKGTFLPWVLGEVENLLPVRVNSPHLIYHVSRKAIAELVGVTEGGNAITPGTSQPDLATLAATAPAGGHFDWYLGNDTLGVGCYFRLGSSPSLQINAYAREGATPADRTIAQIALRVLAEVQTSTGVSTAQTATLSAFDGKQGAVVGYFVGPNGASAGEVLDAICASGGASWTFQRSGNLQISRVEDPTATPVAAFRWDQMQPTPTVAPTDTSTGGVPAYEVSLLYAENNNVMTGSQVAGAVTADRVDWLARQFRTVTASTPAIWDPVSGTGRNPLSQPLTITTRLRAASDAQAEATRLAALYGKRRRYVSVLLPAAVVIGVDLGDVVTLTMPRFGYENGVPHLIVGMAEDHQQETTELFCWA